MIAGNKLACCFIIINLSEMLLPASGSRDYDGGIFPTTWNTSKIVFTIPKTYPPNVPIFRLQTLIPPQEPPIRDDFDEIEYHKRQSRCKSNNKNKGQRPRKKRELSEEKRKETRRGRDKKKEKVLRRKGRNEGRSYSLRLTNARNLRKWKEEDKQSEEGREAAKKRKEKNTYYKFRLAKTPLNFSLHHDYKTGFLTLFLTRMLSNEDYTNVQESFVNVVIQVKEKDECDHYDKKDNVKPKEWKNVYNVRLYIMEPFRCEKLNENMCLLPRGPIFLHQWENRAGGPLLILPSLRVFCPHVKRDLIISMHGLRGDEEPEIRYSDYHGEGIYAPTLDREHRDTLLNFTIKCNITVKNATNHRWSYATGSLYVEDEDDSLPIRVSDTQHVIFNVTHPWQVVKEIFHKPRHRLFVVDPDLKQSNDISMRTVGDIYGLFKVESTFNFEVDGVSCSNQTKHFQKPLTAGCTIIDPELVATEMSHDLPPTVKSLNFSIEIVDKNLIHNDAGNKVWYNITINLIDHTSVSSPDIIDSTEPSNVSIAYPPAEFARIAQVIRPTSNSYMKTTAGPAFSLLPTSQDRGIDITPVLGILYISEPDVLERAFKGENALEIVIVRGSNFTKKLFVRWSGDIYSCNNKLPRPSLITTSNRYPPACSNHEYQDICEDSCGIGSMVGKCSWRSADVKYWTKHYATCSPDFSTCPDNICDELEQLNTNICIQDCVEEHMTKGQIRLNSDSDPPRGIFMGIGVCSCDDFCQCFPVGNSPSGVDKGVQTHFEDPVDKGPIEGACGTTCQIGTVSGVLIVTVMLVVLICRKKKDCGGKFKANDLNFTHHQTDYVDDHSSSYASGPQHGEPHVMVLHAVHNMQHNYPRQNNNNNNQDGGTIDLPTADFSIDRKWEFPRNQLLIEQTLGEGEFGKVMKAKALGIGGTTGYTSVAVKMLKNNSTSVELSDLLSEYDLLKGVNHPNVVRLLGACTTKGGPIFLIMEYCKYRSLRSYLRRTRHFELESRVGSASLEEPDFDYKISPKDLLSFAWQICKGMSYLTNMKLVHRDLAARNVLLAHEKICKISDFGLTRDVYEGDLYFKRSKGKVPVKWMALESLMDHVYTSKSDVWGFGVLLWELVTLGSSPYPGVTPERLFTLLKSGYRMEKPDNCMDELYQVMRACWTEDPNKRPTFNELTQIFERMIQADVEYLELKSLIVTNRTYFDDSAAEMESDNALSASATSKEGLSEVDGKEIEAEIDETKTDQDSYLVAHSGQTISIPHPRRESTEPLLPVVPLPNDDASDVRAGVHIHAHNPAYSPSSEDNPDLSRPIPPPLQYSTLASGPDEEDESKRAAEEIQDGRCSEAGSDSGRATGDSGYLTEEGRHNQTRESPNHSSGKTPSSRRNSRGSYSALTTIGIEKERNITPITAMETKKRFISAKPLVPAANKTSPNSKEKGKHIQTFNKRNPVIV